MSFNERMVRTLQENLSIFAQQLSIPDVYQSFTEILSNAKKNAKSDNLPQIEEFEAKIEEVYPDTIFVYFSFWFYRIPLRWSTKLV